MLAAAGGEGTEEATISSVSWREQEDGTVLLPSLRGVVDQRRVALDYSGIEKLDERNQKRTSKVKR